MDEALIFAIEHGIIDVAELQAQVEEMRKTEYLKNHDHAIWESGGYWFTHVTTSKGRKVLKRKTRESLNELIVETYKQMKVDPTIRCNQCNHLKNGLEKHKNRILNT